MTKVLTLNTDGTIPFDVMQTLTVRDQMALCISCFLKGNPAPIKKMIPSYLDPGRALRTESKVYFKVPKGIDPEEVRTEDFVVVVYDKGSSNWKSYKFRTFAEIRVKELQKYTDALQLITSALNHE